MTGFIGEQLEFVLTTRSQRIPQFRCDRILPDNDPFVMEYDEDLPRCLLCEGHDGDHLIITRRGKFFFWKTELDLSGPFGEPDDDEIGYILELGEAKPEDALQLLAQSPILIAQSLTEQQP